MLLTLRKSTHRRGVNEKKEGKRKRMKGITRIEKEISTDSGPGEPRGLS